MSPDEPRQARTISVIASTPSDSLYPRSWTKVPLVLFAVVSLFQLSAFSPFAVVSPFQLSAFSPFVVVSPFQLSAFSLCFH